MTKNRNWNEIYTQQAPKLIGVCRRYVKNEAIAEDLVQDAFIIAIQRENQYNNKGSFEGWLKRIVVNMSLNYLRDNALSLLEYHEKFDQIEDSNMINLSVINKKSTILSSDFDKNDILNVIDELPEHHKSVFNMYVIDGFSHKEISEALNISTNTSKSHLSRARIKIQELLFDKAKATETDKTKKRLLFFLLLFSSGNEMFSNKLQKN